MSRRSAAPGPTLTGSEESLQQEPLIRSPHVSAREGPLHPVPESEAQAEDGSSASSARRPSVPSPQQTSYNLGKPASRSSRSSDVHSILNPSPTIAEAPEGHGQRRDSSHLDSPVSPLSTPQHRPGSLPRPQLPNFAPHDMTSGEESRRGSLGHMPRRILTPKSPLLRSASLGRVPVPATINAQKSPFLSSPNRTYTAEPGVSQSAEVPPMPTPPALTRMSGSSYGFPAAPTPPLTNRRLSAGTNRASPSQSTSPTTSYSSYSQPSHTSPVPQYGSSSNPPSAVSFYPTSTSTTAASTQLVNGSPITGPPASGYRTPGNPLSQSSYQLLTLDTDQGPIQVPVDVQAASKMADDKRKRNAGASARFRQRRKEKEREASQTISKLEQQIREITEEREFYRQERDYFRRIASGSSGQSLDAQRPPSPHHRPGVHGSASGRWPEAQSEAAERNTRRRTESYQSEPGYSLPPLANPSPTYGGPSPMMPQSYQGSLPAPSAAPSMPAPPPTTRPGTYEQYTPGSYGPGWFSGRDKR